jgi:hypothetical protein
MPKVVTFLLSAFLAGSAFAQQKPADELAKRSFDVIAGPAWEKARYFEFTFVVEHGKTRSLVVPQRWDRDAGLYRLAGRDAKQNDFVVVMNVTTKKGRVWLNGEEVNDRRRDETLDLAFRRFLNDTYWLLMPLRMLDQGVLREPMGERTDSCGRTWDVLKVTTPTNDAAFAWINRDSGLVEEWDMRLAGAPADAPMVQVMFHDYARYAGILISTRREVRNTDQTIRIEGLKIASEVPKGAFDK